MSRLLYVVHALPAWEASGSPLIAQSYMIQALQAGHQVAVAFPHPNKPFAAPAGITAIPLPPAPEKPWALMAYGKAATDVPGTELFAKFKPDIIHIVDWVGLPSGVLKALRKVRVPILRHLWNFEDLCAFNEPIRYLPDYRPCRTLTAETCGDCAVRQLGHVQSAIDGPIDQVIAQLTQSRAAMAQDFTDRMRAKWQVFQRHLDTIYDALVFPCPSFRAYAESLYSFGRIPRHTIEPGIRADLIKSPGRPIDIPRLLFLGPCTSRKGWPVIEAALSRLLTERPGCVRLRAYGAPPQSPLSSFQGVELLPAFDPSRLGEILAWGDVGLAPSPFETFNRVCREFLAQGLPVIGSDAFGIPDAVSDGVNGLIIGHPTPDGLYQAIVRLLDRDGLLAHLQTGAQTSQVRTQAQEFADLSALYRSMAKRK